jgi:hypothetical protein
MKRRFELLEVARDSWFHSWIENHREYPENWLAVLTYNDITRAYESPLSADHCLRHPVFLPPAPADEMAMSDSAAAVSDKNHTNTGESPSECNDMNTGEMTMSQSRARARNCGQQTLGQRTATRTV